MIDHPFQTLAESILAVSPQNRFPLAGQWELTCRCNLKCVMCYTDCFNTPERLQQELSLSEILRILDEVQEAGCVELTLTGGEPLARPDFMQIYEAACRRGLLLTLFTNGTLITPAIADRWAEMSPQRVEISMHGFSSAVFEKVTQVAGSLKRCLEGIQLLVERNIPLTLKAVGLPFNREEILAVKRFAESLSPDVRFKFGEYLRDDLAHTGAPYQLQLTEEELEEIEQQDPRMWKERCSDETATPVCGGGKLTFHIDAYGQLQLCSNNRRASYDLRAGSFREGFYNRLSAFPCPRRAEQAPSPGYKPLTVLQTV